MAHTCKFSIQKAEVRRFGVWPTEQIRPIYITETLTHTQNTLLKVLGGNKGTVWEKVGMTDIYDSGCETVIRNDKDKNIATEKSW